LTRCHSTSAAAAADAAVTSLAHASRPRRSPAVPSDRPGTAPSAVVHIVGRVGQRHRKGPIGRIDATAVEQHDALVLGQTESEIELVDVFHRVLYRLYRHESVVRSVGRSLASIDMVPGNQSSSSCLNRSRDASAIVSCRITRSAATQRLVRVVDAAPSHADRFCLYRQIRNLDTKQRAATVPA
jgi:hypothetical protein